MKRSAASPHVALSLSGAPSRALDRQRTLVSGQAQHIFIFLGSTAGGGGGGASFLPLKGHIVR